MYAYFYFGSITNCVDKICKPIYAICNWLFATCSWHDSANYMTLILEKLISLLFVQKANLPVSSHPDASGPVAIITKSG